MKRTKAHNLWLDVLTRVLKIPEPWGKGTDAKATAILYEEFLLHKALDTGWFLKYEPYGDDAWWPYAIDANGNKHDIRTLAGIIP